MCVCVCVLVALCTVQQITGSAGQYFLLLLLLLLHATFASQMHVLSVFATLLLCLLQLLNALRLFFSISKT